MRPVSLLPDRDRISVAVLALGGQGGGVLADWIAEVANHNGFVAQATSVPGVAQRTGATIYYIEMARRSDAGSNHPAPVLALMPVPGDVDVVIASELMEAGRAMVRGLVTSDRTTLISSTHRVYAIAEKSALGDGRVSSEKVLDAAQHRAGRFIGFDMDASASRAGSMISSVMLGALAASEALPFTREMFEDAIRKGGKATETNLKGFAAGFDGAVASPLILAPTPAPDEPPPEPKSERGRALKARILGRLPRPTQGLAILGVARMMDYQDYLYAAQYLDRLERIQALDDGRDQWRLTAATARHLALWMSYEDTIRVADLKVRGSRRLRVEEEVRLRPGQVLNLTEYMHPRLQEICETLPAVVGRRILRSPIARRILETSVAKGRHVRTTTLRWNLVLRLLASVRPFRRSTLRYVEEQARIEAWLDLVAELARQDSSAAAELVESQELIKGYSDTFERGLANFTAITAEVRESLGESGAAHRIRALREAALADDTGSALRSALRSA